MNTIDALDGYEGFLKKFQARFKENTKNARVLYTTGLDDLFSVYLSGFPESIRQHYNCNSCRKFINAYGGLVTVDAEGNISSPMWNLKDTPTKYVQAVTKMLHAIHNATVTGVFASKDKIWGVKDDPSGWSHFCLVPAKNLLSTDVLKTPYQTMASHRENFKLLERAYNELGMKTVETVLAKLKTGALYRSDRFVGPVEWFYDLKTKLDGSNNRVKNNLLWAAVGTAPGGFANIRNSAVGTFMLDLESGQSYEVAKRKFDANTSSDVYQRAQAAPAAGQVQQAEKIIAELGLAPSLERRYARLSELQKIWYNPAKKLKSKGPVFGHLETKTAKKKLANEPVGSANVMTWAKFRRTVLPDAVSIEALVPATNRFAALVTAQNPEAPPILIWDSEESRNPVSWYYASGIDAEVKARVTAAGGQYDNVDIRASLIWGNRNDLDLSCLTPRGRTIYFGDKRDPLTGGYLDIDMNIRGETNTPVENIRWAKGCAQPGMYIINITNYRYHDFSNQPNNFKLELEVNGQLFHIEGVVPPGAGRTHQLVYFRYDRNQLDTQVSVTSIAKVVASSQASSWGLDVGSYVPVTGIVQSPNMVGYNPAPHIGNHTFFTLEGCMDSTEGLGRGFFTETLRSDLRPIRATLEAYASTATIEGAEDADACGLGMTDQSPWDLTLRVMNSLGTQLYKIDRFD